MLRCTIYNQHYIGIKKGVYTMINNKGYGYNFFRLIIRIVKEMPIISFIVFVFPFISGILTVFVYSSQANIIDIVSYKITSREWIKILITISKPLSIIIFISILQALSSLIEKLYGNKLKERISLIFQKEIIDITNSIEYVKFDDEDFCNKLQRAKIVIGDDLINILFNFTSAINIGTSLLSIVLLASTSGFYSISIIITMMIIINLFIKMNTELKVRKVNREITLEGRMGDYLLETLTQSKTIREMRIYDATNYFFELWGSIITKQHNKRMSARRTEIKVGMITTSIQTLTIFIVLSLLVKNITISDKISIGLIATLFIALIQSGRKILTLTWPLSKLYINCCRLYDFHEFLNLKKTLLNTDNNKVRKNLSPIVLSNIEFTYRNSNHKILSNIDLVINRNEKIAIVGANGVGKSTLVKLIIGLYSPDSGSISWNGYNKIHHNISVVFQNYIKFELTLRENIAMGNIKEINNDELILETMKLCNCFDIYEELGSIDIPLGRTIKGGRELSIGQWQKIAISRAIFSNSDLLIFDEPTAALDPNTEVKIFNNIINLSKDKTAIFISHRLGWAKNADRIIVIDEGTIKEIGNHDELMQLNGCYANMYAIQSSWYN